MLGSCLHNSVVIIIKEETHFFQLHSRHTAFHERGLSLSFLGCNMDTAALGTDTISYLHKDIIYYRAANARSCGYDKLITNNNRFKSLEAMLALLDR